MRFLLVAIAITLAFVGAACSSDDNKSSNGGAAAASPTAAPPPLATIAAAALSGAPGGSSQPRVNGNVQTASAGQVTLSDGTTFQLAPNARIARLQTIKSTDLKTGQFVAITAKRQADNTLLASIVSIFPDSLSNVVPGGERPLPEGNLMTNATIDSISGNSFTVTFTGGGGKVTLAPDARLIKQIDATPADLSPGTMVNAGVTNGVAASVLIQ
jgi:Domain of unknown function (DUF5666)